MSTYPAPDLLQQWKNSSLSAEQAIGHMLQHLVLLYEQNTELFSRTATNKASLEDLANRVAIQAAQGSPRVRKRRNPEEQ